MARRRPASSRVDLAGFDGFAALALIVVAPAVPIVLGLLGAAFGWDPEALHIIGAAPDTPLGSFGHLLVVRATRV